MSGRGSERRQKTRPVLVRLEEAEYLRLTTLADREGTSRAEYLRRRIGHVADDTDVAGASSASLAEADRILMAQCARTMGHLAGMLKHSGLKVPSLGRSAELRSILDQHHGDLQALQGQLRQFLERHK